MSKTFRGDENPRTVLATDLDGTLIPLLGSSKCRQSLDTLRSELRRLPIMLVFVTGRNLDSVESAITEFDLPVPEWIICGVGTTIFQRSTKTDESPTFLSSRAYEQHLDTIVDGFRISDLQKRFRGIPGLRLQEEQSQGRHKLSYWADPPRLDSIVGTMQQRLEEDPVPYSIVASHDPTTGKGYVDLLPRNVSKAHALHWWAATVGVDPNSICFAGDSGNDLAAFVAGYLTIVVGNADRRIAEEVSQAHQAAGWSNRLCLATNPSTSGVLEGCRWFELIEGES
jgi:HAD superfamily hydrolase (TIGR01484 family)